MDLDFIWFNLFSMFESIAMLVLMLALFRFRTKQYLVQILFSSFILSQLSFYLRTVFELDSLVPLAYLIFLILLVWLVFQIQVFYASIMAIITYFVNTIVQGLIIFVSINLNLFMIEEITTFTFLSYVNIFVSSALILIFAFFITKKRFGFTFVPFSNSQSIKLRGENLVFFIIFIVSIIIAGLHMTVILNDFYSFITVIALFILTLAGLVFLSIRREKLDD